LQRADDAERALIQAGYARGVGGAPDGTALERHAATGALWTISTSLGARIIGLSGTLLLTHFIAPRAYGEVSLAAVVIQTAQAVSSCGISQYIVSRPRGGREAAFHATFYSTALGVLALAAVTVGRSAIGDAVGAPGMAAYVPGLAIAGLLERVGMIQDRILIRDMRFRSLGLQRSLGEVVYAGVTVALAWAGWGAGAMVWGSIVRSAVRLATLSATTPRRAWLSPCAITWARTRDLFAFGLPMSIASVAAFGARRWDNLVFGSLFGEATAGIYNLAYNLADIPATQIGETIGDVLVPSFAHMDSESRRRAALLRSMRLLLLIVAPLSLGLGVVAPTLVRAFFDARWAAVGPMLTLLSALSVVRPIGWIGASYLQVKDRPRAIMVLEITKTGGLLAAIALLGRLGPLAACAAVGLAFTINSFGYFWVIRRVDGVSLRDQIGPLARPVLATAPMVLAVLGARHAVARLGGAPAMVALGVELCVGAAAFVPSALLLAPADARDLLGLVRKAMGRRAG
jgi:lipopolysaccharide exporter